MGTDSSTPLVGPAISEVRRVRVSVVDGPDLGRQAESIDDPVDIGCAQGNTLRLTDKTVSRFHLELVRHGSYVRVTDHGSTNGTTCGSCVLRNGSIDLVTPARLQLGGTVLSVEDGGISLVPEEEVIDTMGMVGTTPAMQKLFRTIQRVAASDVSVLVQGESGTGKELVARAVHQRSRRASGPFVVVDCASIPPTMIASHLFGHERGAFTGADRRRIGAFERAHQGTLFLDEVAELTPEMQSALLGVLERGQFLRLGGTEEVEVDVRVVAATHQDLRASVNEETFRLDLFYRLAVVRLHLPPLRERIADLPALIERFLVAEGCSDRVDRIFPPEAMDGLKKYLWPGNIRELRNVVLGTLALGTPQEPPNVELGGQDPFAAVLDLEFRTAKRQIVEAFEQRYVRHHLDAANGVVKHAAAQAGMDRSYLMELIKRYDIKSAK